MLRTPQDILDALNKPSISYETLKEARNRVSVMLANVQSDPEADRTHKIAISGILRVLHDLVESYWDVSRERIREVIDNLKDRIQMLIELVQKLSPKTRYRLHCKVQEMHPPPSIRLDPQVLPDFPDLSSLRLPPHAVAQEYSKGPTRGPLGSFGPGPFNTDRQPHISITRPSTSTTSQDDRPPEEPLQDLTQVNEHGGSQSNLTNISSTRPSQQSRQPGDQSSAAFGFGDRTHRPPRPLVTVTLRTRSGAESRLVPQANPSFLTDYDLRIRTPPEEAVHDHRNDSVETQRITGRENVSGPRGQALPSARRYAINLSQTGAHRSESDDGWATGSHDSRDGGIQNLASPPGPSITRHSHEPYPTHNVPADSDDDDDDMYCSE